MLSVTIDTSGNILNSLINKYPIFSVLDVTYSDGQLWKPVEKEGLIVTSVDIDDNSKAEHKIDFKDFQSNKKFDAILYDPPYNFNKSGFRMKMGAKLVWKKDNKQRIKFTPQQAKENAYNLNELASKMVKEKGYVLVKVCDARYKKVLFSHHSEIIHALKNFNLEELLVYIKLNNMVASRENCIHIIHGYWMVFQKKICVSPKESEQK